jgi:hypothetical protein
MDAVGSGNGAGNLGVLLRSSKRESHCLRLKGYLSEAGHSFTGSLPAARPHIAFTFFWLSFLLFFFSSLFPDIDARLRLPPGIATRRQPRYNIRETSLASETAFLYFHFIPPPPAF